MFWRRKKEAALEALVFDKTFVRYRRGAALERLFGAIGGKHTEYLKKKWRLEDEGRDVSESPPRPRSPSELAALLGSAEIVTDLDAELMSLTQPLHQDPYLMALVGFATVPGAEAQDWWDRTFAEILAPDGSARPALREELAAGGTNVDLMDAAFMQSMRAYVRERFSAPVPEAEALMRAILQAAHPSFEEARRLGLA